MLLTILLITYYVAINIYGIVIMNMQKKEVGLLAECKETGADTIKVSADEADSGIIADDVNQDAESPESKNTKTEKSDKENKKKDEQPISCTDLKKHRIKDSKVIVTAMLGGALGIYIAMLSMKYRLRNMIFMVGMPVLVALNIYFIVMAFRNWIVL